MQDEQFDRRQVLVGHVFPIGNDHQVTPQKIKESAKETESTLLLYLHANARVFISINHIQQLLLPVTALGVRVLVRLVVWSALIFIRK